MQKPFVPQIIKPFADDRIVYLAMLIEAEICPICQKIMTRAGKSFFNGGNFPNAMSYNFDTQIKNAGVVVMSKIQVDDHCICIECANAGKADFLCALCNIRRPTDQVQESFGEPPEYLCKICYETVPAKQWDMKTSELYSQHQYDFE